MAYLENLIKIIEENLNATSTTPSNDIKLEKQAKVLNAKKNLNTENDKRKTNKNLEVFVSKTITESNIIDPKLNENQTSYLNQD